MCEAKNCFKTCINKEFLLNEQMLNDAQEIVANLPIKAMTGRPPIDFIQAINGIYYLLKTGIQWQALPRCFGSASAIHRCFQKLIQHNFFEKLWHKELEKYNEIHGLKLEVQAGDCAHIKAPLGQEKTGKSPVDRKKLGTKRSIIVERNGIVIGCALGSGNQHDSKLFEASIRSIPKNIQQPYYKEMHLDSAYDSNFIHMILFNTYYVPKISKNKRNSKKIIIQKSEKKRWIVESAHSWMNRFKRLLIRFEKSAINYFSFMQFAFSIITFKKIGV
jgi:putative transposase